MSQQSDNCPEWEDEEWERIMRRAFSAPVQEDRGRRLYIHVIRRAALMVLAALDAHYHVEEPRRVDKPGRRRS